MSKPYKSNPAILNEARDYLDGLMLGDGHIERRSIITGRYCHICKEKSWLDKISEYLGKYEIRSNIDNERLQFGGLNAKDGSITYNIRTYSYLEFREMRNRWYIKWYDIDNYPEIRWHEDVECKGDWYVWKKIVPEDICLSPECVANWYLGDGGTYKYSYSSDYWTLLCTNDFLREDVVFLLDLLSEVLDIKCSINKAGMIGIYNRADISTLLNYIKYCEIPDYYQYKFPKGVMS